MNRLACVVIALAAGCGGSGFSTGTATLSGLTPTPMSASATSFNAADGAGTMVMGWKISFWEQADGADCQSADTHRVAAVSIFTGQAVASGKKATLELGDVVIVTDSPPTVAGTGAATMGAEGLGQIVGSVSITQFHLKTDFSADEIKGSISAGGNDSNGAGVAISGSFDAPVCE
ncbi:hypothetical protein BH11MYX1_BH11MYX1_18390 [soil metagenome]